MSDSGFTAGLTPPSLLQAGRDLRAESKPPTSVEIIKISEEIRSSHTNETLRGHIERRDRNGDLHIKTDKGEITVRPPPESDLKEGDTIDIKIQANASSITAQIRQKPLPPQTQATPTPPEQVNVQDYLKILDAIQNPKPLTLDEPVQLIPLTPAQIKSIVSLPVVSLLPTTMQVPPILLNSVSVMGEFEVLPALQTVPLQTTLSQTAFSSPDDFHLPLNVIADAATPDILPLRSVIAQIMKASPDALISFSSSEGNNKPIFQGEHNALITKILPQDTIIFPPSENADEQSLFTIPQFAKAGEVEARIIGVTPEREFPVLKIFSAHSSEQQIFFIPQHIKDLPEGRLIVLSPLPISVDEAAQGVALQILSSTSSLIVPPLLVISADITPLWDTADEVYQTLLQHSSTLAQNMAAIIPNTASPAKMANTALFFIAALRSGDLQSWMGEKTIDALKRAGKSDLLNKFSKEISDLGREESSGQTWRSTAFPMVHGENIHRVLLHYRKEQRHSDDEKQQGGGITRFIMDLSLSKIGKVQLDGLFQGNESKSVGRLDLIVRTQTPFSKAIQGEMRTLYKDTLDETAYTGELAFQSNPDQWVRITPHHAPSNYSKNI